jgi:hypothetical protein
MVSRYRGASRTTLPNFIVVGAEKRGTTALFHYLNQHPQVYLSAVKEPLFFCSYGVERSKLERELYPAAMENVITDYDRYVGLFSDAKDEKAVGEASVYYLVDYEKTIGNIRRLLPGWKNLKIVIILRNPIDASFSHYLMYSQILRHYLNRRDVLSFEESLAAEEKRLADGYLALAHFHWFFYYEQVKAYMESFENVRIFLFSELTKDPSRVIRDLYSFLEVDSSFVPEAVEQEYNLSGVARLGFLYRFLISDSAIRRLLRPVVRRLLSEESRDRLVNRALRKPMKKPAMAPETRERLRRLYREDIVELQCLIDRDLSAWLAE